jgi:lipoprotein-anchoring transpeptidase ErfK/SrfK
MPFSIFFEGGYAIHGTYDLKRLGRPASHGCVRLHPDAAEALYEVVEYYGMESTVVRIVP